MSGKDGNGAASAAAGEQAPQSAEDLTVFVQQLLTQMQTRFEDMSDTIVGRIDDMGKRIDELESSIGELMAQAGVEDELASSGKDGAGASAAGGVLKDAIAEAK